MPLQQFDERLALAVAVVMTSAYVAGTSTDLVPISPQTSRVDALQGINTDTVIHTGEILLNNGSTYVSIGGFSLPAGAGVGATPPVDLLAAILPSAMHYITFPGTYKLAVALDAAPAAGKTCTVVALGGQL